MNILKKSFAIFLLLALPISGAKAESIIPGFDEHGNYTPNGLRADGSTDPYAIRQFSRNRERSVLSDFVVGLSFALRQPDMLDGMALVELERYKKEKKDDVPWTISRKTLLTFAQHGMGYGDYREFLCIFNQKLVMHVEDQLDTQKKFDAYMEKVARPPLAFSDPLVKIANAIHREDLIRRSLEERISQNPDQEESLQEELNASNQYRASLIEQRKKIREYNEERLEILNRAWYRNSGTPIPRNKEKSETDN